MANQNLSQFGEKLFVADADHTFIWDSAASISKRVSRNSWLNSGTLTSDAPVTISQTWNNAAVAFTGLKFNAAGTSGTNSSAASLLLDLQVGTVSKFKVDKDGVIVIGAGAIKDWGSGQLGIGGSGAALLYVSNFAIQTTSAFAIGASFGIPTVFITRDADNTLALRNGAAAQTFNVYGTSSASNANYARLALTCGLDGNATISTQALGTGTAGVLAFSPGNSERMRITTAGNVGIGTTAPTAPLEIRATAATGIRESLLKCTVSDAGNDAFHVFNGTATDGRFGPSFSGSTFSSNVGGIAFVGQTNSANDTGTAPLVAYQARITSSETDPNNGTLSAVATRPLFSWFNHTTAQMQMAANGNVGIGTTSPTSKLQVSAGDVEVDTIAKGVILKSPDGTRYRVTVANGGTLLVAAV